MKARVPTSSSGIGLLDVAFGGRKRGNNHAHVVAELGRGIVNGTFGIGSTLPGDEQLCARFGFSRTVLREAMKTLAAKNLIEPKARVGTRVLDRSRWNLFDMDVLTWRFEAGLDEQLLLDLAEMRIAFEPAAAVLAARRATVADVARLYAIVERMSDASQSSPSFVKVDLEFHLAVAEISNNPFMRSISALVEAALAVAFKVSNTYSTDLISQSAAAHRRVVDAIAAGDQANARLSMLYLIEDGVARTLQSFGKTLYPKDLSDEDSKRVVANQPAEHPASN